MTRVIIIDLMGVDEESKAESKAASTPVVKREKWSAPAEGLLLEIASVENLTTMPVAYRARPEKYFRK